MRSGTPRSELSEARTPKASSKLEIELWFSLPTIPGCWETGGPADQALRELGPRRPRLRARVGQERVRPERPCPGKPPRCGAQQMGGPDCRGAVATGTALHGSPAQTPGAAGAQRIDLVIAELCCPPARQRPQAPGRRKH